MVLLMGSMLGLSASAALGQCGTPLTTERVVTGLSSPVFVTAPPGDTGRLFIVEQGGTIRIFDLNINQLLPSPFLSITVTPGGERGLLGLTFDPDYGNNGCFYVNYTLNLGSTLYTFIARFQVTADPNVADPDSEFQIMRIAQPFSNHNAGWLDFGPDGYLYIATGDGGSGGDPGNRAQTITDQLLGKMLRIDVSNSGPGNPYDIPPDNPFVGITGDDEIWAYGLRNPWRNAFDRATGDLYIADVGQGQWEEVNFQPASSTGGENYGWRCYEGNHPYNTGGCPPMNELVFPIHEYSHAQGCSINGGYVYRGEKIRDLRGTYFFADYCSDQIWSFRHVGGQVIEFANRTAELQPPVGSLSTISSFGEDARGELFICTLGGSVFRIVPDGVLLGDLNNDDMVDFGDINPFVLALTDPVAYTAMYGLQPEEAGDINCDGKADFGDINPFVTLQTM